MRGHPLLPAFILERHAQGERSGSLAAAAVAADISGFTALTEGLARHGREGAEVLMTTLRRFFDPLVRAVERRGGFVAQFSGDGFLAIFPGAGDRDAARTAAELAGIAERGAELRTRLGTFALRLRVGSAAGSCAWRIVASSQGAAAYYFHGAALRRAVGAASTAPSGDAAGSAARPRARTPPRSTRRALDPGPFLPPGVAELPAVGEFRDVTSLFLAFDEGPRAPAVAARILEAIQSHGGTLSRFDFAEKGPHAVAFFGAPLAHEDDTSRAVACARALVGGRRREGIRAGIACGVSYAGFNGGTRRHELTCLGVVTNAAARLMQLARAGQLLVTREVAARTARRHRTKDAGRVALRGFSEPVAVALVVGERRAAARRAAAGEPELPSRVAARRALLARGRPLRDREMAGVVLLEGAAGMGKWRLVEALRRDLGPDVRLLVARCEAGPRLSLRPLQRLLSDVLDQLPARRASENRRAMRRRLAALARALPRSEETLRREIDRADSILAALLGHDVAGSLYASLDPELRLENTMRAIAAVVRGLCLEAPTILLVDQAQWADADSRRAIEAILRSPPAPRLVIVSSSDGPDGGELDVPPGTALSRIALPPLDAGEVALLAGRLLGATPEGPLLAFLLSRGEGNPRIVEELVSYLRVQGRLAVDGGRGTLRALRAIASDVPDGLRGLLAARLDRLSAPARELVKAAAILGSEQELLLLQELAGHDVTRPLLEAVSAGILNREERGRLRFASPLLLEAAYEMQPRAQLRRGHRRAARLLEAQEGGTPPGVVARHWERAEMRRRARRAYLAAARDALARYANEEAELHFRAHLRLCPRPSREWLASATDLADRVYYFTMDFDAMAQLHQSCIEDARKLHNRRLLAVGLDGLGRALRNQGQPERTERLLDEALGIARAAGPRELVGELTSSLGNLRFAQGRLEEAVRCYEEALEILERHGKPSKVGLVVGSLASVQTEIGRYDASRASFARALRIYEELGDLRNVGAVTLNMGGLAFESGDIDGAEALFRKAGAIAEEVGYAHLATIADGNLAGVAHRRGDDVATRAILTRTLASQRTSGTAVSVALTLDNLAVVAVRLGDLAEARERALESLAWSTRIGDAMRVATALVTLGQVATAEGGLEEADLHLRRAAETARPTGSGALLAGALVTRARTRRLLGKDVGALLRRAAAALETSEDLEWGTVLSCERGHACLQRGRSAVRWLARARASLPSAPEPRTADAVARLARAEEARASGALLFQGEHPGDVPPARAHRPT